MRRGGRGAPVRPAARRGWREAGPQRVAEFTRDSPQEAALAEALAEDWDLEWREKDVTTREQRQYMRENASELRQAHLDLRVFRLGLFVAGRRLEVNLAAALAASAGDLAGSVRVVGAELRRRGARPTNR